jgi:hypothetical protein
MTKSNTPDDGAVSISDTLVITYTQFLFKRVPTRFEENFWSMKKITYHDLALILSMNGAIPPLCSMPSCLL